MASCCKLRILFQAFHKNSFHNLGIAQRSFCLLGSVQGRPEVLFHCSKLTCLLASIRHEVTFSSGRRKFVPHHKQDGVTPDWACVFENNMNRYHFWGQLTVSIMAIPIYGISLQILKSSWNLQDFSLSGGLLTPSAYIFLYSVLFFGVHILCQRSIKRIYADEDGTNYAAVVQDWKMMSRTIFFTLDDAKRLPPGKVWGSFFGNVLIKGRPYMLTPTDFVKPMYYNLIMGYDLQRSVDLDIIKDIDIKDLLRKNRGVAKPHVEEKEQARGKL